MSQCAEQESINFIFYYRTCCVTVPQVWFPQTLTQVMLHICIDFSVGGEIKFYYYILF